MRALFYDTETTGLPNFRDGPGGASWPDVTQFAAKLVDLKTRKTEACLQFYVKPEREIHPDAARVTGIDLDHIMKFGVTRRFMVAAFSGIARNADLTICHNRQFDDTVIKTAFIREGHEPMNHPGFCTKDATTNLVKAPKKPNRNGVVMGGYKWPTLTEAHGVLCQGLKFNMDLPIDEVHDEFAKRATLEGAHDAMNDVNFMIEIFWKIWDEYNIRPRICAEMAA